MERLLLFILVSAALDLWGQTTVSWRLNTDQGLPSSMVYDLQIDQAGRVWMGTQNGLVYYDGNTIHRPEGENAVGDRSHIVVRQNGAIWCSDFDRSLFTADIDSIHLKHTFNSRIRAVQNVNDTVYVLTRTELIRFLPDKDSSEVVYASKDVWGFGGAVFKLSDKVEHLPTGNELQHLNEIGSSLACFSNNTYYRYFFDVGTVLEMQPDGYDTVCVSLHRPMQPPSKLTGIKHTSAGLWVIGYDGAFLVDSAKWFLEGTPVSDVVESEDGFHWFSTLSSGTIIIPNLEAKKISKPQGLKNNQITRVKFTDDGKLLSCDNSGVLHRIDLSNGQVERTFYSNVSRQGELVASSRKTDFTYAGFGALYALDKELQLKDNIPLGNFKKLREDAFGDLLVLSHIEIWRIQLDKDGAFNVMDKQVPPDSCRPVDLAVDAANNFWLLTKCNVFFNDSTVPFFTDKTPYLLTLDDAENAWLYSSSDTVFSLEGTNVLNAIPVPTSMQSEQPPLRMMYTGNLLLLLFNDQLLTYSFEQQNWSRLSAADGLPKTDLTDIDVYGNTVAISSFDGIYLLPLRSRAEQVNPKLELTSVLVNGEEIAFGNQPVKLEYDQRNLEFQFAGIAPESRGDLFYEYQLLGSGGKASETSDESNFKLRSLSEGDYKLEVSVVDAKRKRSELKKLSFSVLPPWYASNLFLIAVGLLLFLTGLSVYALRMRSVRKSLAIVEERNQLLENARTSQLTALRAQLNPHFLFNALNSVQGLFSMGMEQKANEAMGLFSRLMRKLLEHSEEEKISLAAELEMLSMYLDLEAVRFGDDFRFEIDLGEEINAEQTMIPPLLIQPYVENAVKHGLLHREGEKRLKLSIQKVAEDALRIMVADNGIGREAAAKLRKKNHRPFGTKANATRLELLNSMRQNPITVVTEDKSAFDTPTGTTVIISIPLKK